MSAVVTNPAAVTTVTTVTSSPEMEGGGGGGGGAGGPARKRRKSVHTQHVGWIPEEDAFIAKWAMERGGSWAKCARALRAKGLQERTPSSVRNRHKRLVTRGHADCLRGDQPLDAAAYARAASFVNVRDKTTTQYCRLATWSARERATLERLAAAYPNRWQRIAEQLPGRDAAAVRHRWARMRTTAAAADDAEGAEGEEGEEGEECEEEEE